MKKIALILITTLLTLSAHANITIWNSFINFGNVDIDSYGSTRSVTIYNNDSSEVTINVSDMCFLSGFSSRLLFPRISGNGSTSITVEFSPKEEGFESCTLTVTSHDNDYESIHLSGYGVKSDWP